MKRVIAAVIGLVLAVSMARAVPPAPSWDHVKVMIHKKSIPASTFIGTQSIPGDVLRRARAVVLDDQPGYTLVDVPTAELNQLQDDAMKNGALSVEPRADFDRLDFLSFPIDARDSEPNYPLAYARANPLPGPTRDSFVIQFSSTPRPEWLAALQNGGATIVDYIPQNAFTILASVTVITELQAQLPIQLLRLHQPVHKIEAALRASADDFEDVTIIMMNVPEADDAREYLKTVSLREHREPDVAGDRSYLRLTIPTDAVAHLAAFPAVLWIERSAAAVPSGEREVNVAAGLGTWMYPQTLTPGNPGTYRGWLSNNLLNTESSEPIALLDTGWHRGAGSTHNDLLSSAGANRVTPVNYTNFDSGSVDSDCYGHGTMVAGLLAGNAGAPFSTQTKDNGGTGFLMGLGVIPGASVVSGRIFVLGAGPSPQYQPKSWTTIFSDLLARGVKVTNNSYNLRGPDGNPLDTTALAYTADAQLFDKVVRHAGGNDLSSPMTLVVSAGNRDEPPTGIAYITSPATAKNVISVGGTQNYNFNSYPDPIGGTGVATNANAMWASSRVGPTYEDGRIKPDVVAVSTAVESVRTEQTLSTDSCQLNPAPAVGGTIDSSPVNQRHIWSRGTSFSAPIASGAAGLLRLWQGNPSPAMQKAQMINFATPLANNGAAVDYSPHSDYGWGRVDLSRAFHRTFPTGYYSIDQSIMMTPGGPFVQTPSLSIKDPNRPIKITLVWTDSPGTPGTGTQLRNDLDLVVYSLQYIYYTSGNAFDSHTGYSALYGLGRQPPYDRKNNVEQVVLEPNGVNAFGSPIRIEIRNTSVITNALAVWSPQYPAQQDFALFVENVQ